MLWKATKLPCLIITEGQRRQLIVSAEGKSGLNFGNVWPHLCTHRFTPQKSLEDKKPNSSARLEALRDSYIVFCIQLEMD